MSTWGSWLLRHTLAERTRDRQVVIQAPVMFRATPRQICFAILTIYAWTLALFVNRNGSEDDDILLYAATVAPAVLLILLSLRAYFRSRYGFSELVLVGFAIATVAVACSRADFPTAVSIGVLCAVLIGIRNSGVFIGVGLTNTLFFLSIIASGILHALGYGQYGLLPGQSFEDYVPWRASIFTYNVTTSWLFALIVIGINYFHNRWRFGRAVMILLGLYFLLFSASRTGLLILALCIVFLLATRFIRLRDRLFYRLFIPCAVAIFILAVSAELVLTMLSSVDSPLLNAVLFKSTQGARNIEQASTSIERTILWTAHLEIFSENPWFGHGTFTLTDEEAPNTTGSESFITGLFARTGSFAVLFVWFMYLLSKSAARQQDRFTYCAMIFLCISSFAYGSYLVPYDFLLLLLFGVMNYSRHVRTSQRAAASS